MATHDVTFEIPSRSLGKSDVKFVVNKDGERFGTLAISQGAIVWFPKGKNKGKKMSWTRFDELMNENARRIERR